MDSLELSKIAGAALAALLLIFGMKVVIDSRQAAHSSDVVGYKLPTEATVEAAPAPAPAPAAAPKTDVAAAPAAKPDAAKADVPKATAPKTEAPKVAGTPPAAVPAPAPAAPAAAGGFDAKAVVAKLATASADDGKATFKKCSACHVVDKAASSKVAPNLWGIVGRAKGAHADYAGYSEAMKAKGGEWSYENLAAFIYKPKGYIAGTKMVFNGINDPAEIANLIAYLRTLSDSPAALPK